MHASARGRPDVLHGPLGAKFFVPLLLLYHNPNVLSLLCTHGTLSMPCACTSLLSTFSLVSFSLFSFFDFFPFLGQSSTPPPPPSLPLSGIGEEELAPRGSLGGGVELERLSMPLLLLLLVPLAGRQVL